MSFAELVLDARTDGLRRAKGDLDDLRNTGARTEQGVSGSMGKMSKGFNVAAIAAGKMAVAATAAIASVAGIGQAIGVIRQFESSMSQVAAITGATTAELAALRDVAKDLGSTTEFSAAQAADGLKFLGMAGFNAAESIKAIPAVLDLATASAMGLAQAADISSNVLSGFGLAAGEAAQVADVLAAASSRSNTSVAQLGGAMSTVAPIAAALDISLQDTAAAIGVMSDAGIQGERAGTALRGVLASLAGPTEQAADALSKYGVTVADVDPATRSLTEIFGLLQERGLSTADAMEIFGREAASGALVLTEASARVGEFGEELRGAEGAASDMASIMRDNLGGAANTLMSTVQGLAIALGEAGLTAVLVAALDGATALVRGLTMLVEGIGAAIDFVRRHTTATEAVTEAMLEQTLQGGDLKTSTDDVADASRNAAEAALQEARARMAVIDAQRETMAMRAMESEAYQNLEFAIGEATIAYTNFMNEQERNGGRFAPMADEDARALDDIKTRLILARNAQQELLESATFTSTEYNNLQGDVARLEAELALAAASGGKLPDEIIPLSPIITSATGNVSALKSVLDGAAAAARALAGAMASAASQLGPLGSALSALGGGGILGRVTGNVGGILGNIINSDAVDAAGNRLAQLGNTMKILFERSKEAAVAQDQFASSLGSAGGAAGSAEKDVKALADEISRLEDAADPTRKFVRELARLDELRALKNGLSDGAYAEGVRALNEELVESTPLLQGVNDAFGNMVDYMFDGFKDGMKGILNIFVNSLKQMAAAALKSRITIGVGMAGGAGGAAAAGTPGMGGGGWLSALGSFGGGVGAGFSQAIGAGSAGIFNVMGNAQAAVAASQGAVSAFSATVGAALPVIGAAVAGFTLLKSAIGTTTKLTNAIEGRFELAGLTGGGEYDLKENDGWFSKGIEKNFEAWEGSWAEDIGRHADETFREIAGQVRQSITDMGLEVQDFVHDFDFQFKEGSLEPGALYTVVEEEARKAGDAMLKAALEAAGLAREGETGAETLQILNQAMNTVNGTLLLFGQSMIEADANIAGGMRSLIEMSGGLDAFNTKVSTVFEGMLTTQQQTERATAVAQTALDGFNSTFEELGIVLPETHAGFMDLLNSADLTTEGGRNLYAALLDVADEFVTVNGTAQQVADAAANELVPALEDTGDAARDAAEAARELAAIEREREGLLLQIARMTGNTNYIRQQELAALDDSNRALQEHIYQIEDQSQALEAANNRVAAMESNLADANSNLEQAYSAIESAVKSRLETLEQERDGYLAAADAARDALVALGAIAETQTPLERAQDATRAYEDALSSLSAGINRERSALESNISGWQSEAERLRDALFPGSDEDVVAALAVQDVISETLELSEMLANSARDVLRLNSDIVERQRTSALAQLRAMLAAGQVDRQTIDRATSDATSFNSAQFGSFEEMALEQKKTAGVLQSLSQLQEDQAEAAQKAEEERAEAARQTAMAQLAALDAQIAQGNRQIETLDTLADSFGLIEEELDSSVLADQVTQLKAAADAANAEAVAFYSEELSANTALADATSQQITELKSQYGAILSVNNSVQAVEQAVANLATAQQAVADATIALADAQASQAAAQQAVDKTPTIAEARLLGILGATDGGTGATLLGTDALGQMSEGQMNAMLTAAGVAALTGTARDVAMAYRDELGRNVDVEGLQFYVDGLVTGAITLSGVVDDLATSTEAITGVIPGFAISGVPTAPIPSYAQGTDYHPGGLARLHESELINLPRGTSVSTAGEVREMVQEIKELRRSNQEMAVELRQIRRFAQSRTDILEDQRAEQLAAEATA